MADFTMKDGAADFQKDLLDHISWLSGYHTFIFWRFRKSAILIEDVRGFP
jgi:hypothetical protein